MTTTDLIELLKKVEHGASGRPRELSVYVDDKRKMVPYKKVKVFSTGDGIAGAELSLIIQK